MKYHKLQIAWSVAWGVVAVLLCVLWLRSFTTLDEVYGEDGRYYFVSVTSRCGTFYVLAHFGANFPPHRREWEFEHEPLRPYSSGSSHGYCWDSGEYIVIPMAYPVVVGTLLSAAPWLRWSKRFSLRTLLIATTLIAVGLGLVVWIARG